LYLSIEITFDLDFNWRHDGHATVREIDMRHTGQREWNNQTSINLDADTRTIVMNHGDGSKHFAIFGNCSHADQVGMIELVFLDSRQKLTRNIQTTVNQSFGSCAVWQSVPLSICQSSHSRRNPACCPYNPTLIMQRTEHLDRSRIISSSMKMNQTAHAMRTTDGRDQDITVRFKGWHGSSVLKRQQ